MEVSSSTAPRWIKEALKLTVTDVSILEVIQQEQSLLLKLVMQVFQVALGQ